MQALDMPDKAKNIETDKETETLWLTDRLLALFPIQSFGSKDSKYWLMKIMLHNNSNKIVALKHINIVPKINMS